MLDCQSKQAWENGRVGEKFAFDLSLIALRRVAPRNAERNDRDGCGESGGRDLIVPMEVLRAFRKKKERKKKRK